MAYPDRSTRRALLTRLHLRRPDLRDIVGAEFLLVRPDHHAAWRGSGEKLDVAKVPDHVRGCCTSAGTPVTSVSRQAQVTSA